MAELVLALTGRTAPRALPRPELESLKQAARTIHDAGYGIRCFWDKSPRLISTIPEDWDARLRPTYPSPRPENFDPFENCPQQGREEDADSKRSAAAPSAEDCYDAFAKSFPQRFFSRPILSADGRYAAVYEGGWVTPHRGGYDVMLLHFHRGVWRIESILWWAKG